MKSLWIVILGLFLTASVSQATSTSANPTGIFDEQSIALAHKFVQHLKSPKPATFGDSQKKSGAWSERQLATELENNQTVRLFAVGRDVCILHYKSYLSRLCWHSNDKDGKIGLQFHGRSDTFFPNLVSFEKFKTSFETFSKQKKEARQLLPEFFLGQNAFAKDDSPWEREAKKANRYVAIGDANDLDAQVIYLYLKWKEERGADSVSGAELFSWNSGPARDLEVVKCDDINFDAEKSKINAKIVFNQPSEDIILKSGRDGAKFKITIPVAELDDGGRTCTGPEVNNKKWPCLPGQFVRKSNKGNNICASGCSERKIATSLDRPVEILKCANADCSKTESVQSLQQVASSLASDSYFASLSKKVEAYEAASSKRPNDLVGLANEVEMLKEKPRDDLRGSEIAQLDSDLKMKSDQLVILTRKNNDIEIASKVAQNGRDAEVREIILAALSEANRAKFLQKCCDDTACRGNLASKHSVDLVPKKAD